MWKSLSYMLEWQTAVVDNWIKHDFAIDVAFYFDYILRFHEFYDTNLHLNPSKMFMGTSGLGAGR